MTSNTGHKRRHSRGNHSGGNRRATLADVRDRAATVGDDMKELAATAGAAAYDQLSPLEQYVREKPLKSMLIAAGAGALLGVLFSRR